METEDVAMAVPHPAAGNRNLQIQWLRALAAVMVVLFHASVYGLVLKHDDSFLKILDGRLGISGVSLFFAISGYLMATAIKVQQPFTFLAHRVIRIYPALLVATALYVLVEYGLHQPLRVSLAGLVLAPVGVTMKYPLRVEWTLVFEVTFYIGLFFIGLTRGARYLTAIALVWLAVLASMHWLVPDTAALMFPIQRILLACENVGMACGLLIPALLRLRLPPLLLLLGGIAAWPVYTLHPMGNEAARWLFGCGGALVVAGAVASAQRWPRLGQNRTGHALAKFGDYSYALYLIHVPVIYTLYSTVYGLPFPVLWALALMVTFGLAILLGTLDLRLYRIVKAWLKTVPPQRVRGAMIIYLLIFFYAAAAPGWKAHVIAARQEAARELVTAFGPFNTIDQARSAALAAGFAPSSDLIGAIESAKTGEAGFEIAGWAVDKATGKKPALLALFQNGHLLAAGAPWFARPDIQQRFATKAKTGFGFTLPVPCDDKTPIIGVLLAPDRRFAIMPGSLIPECGPK